MADRLVKTGELAREIGVKPSTVRGYVASGRLVPDRRTPGKQALFYAEKAKRILGVPDPSVREDTGSMTVADKIPSSFAGVPAPGPRRADALIAGYGKPSRAEFDAGWLGGEREPLPDYRVTSTHTILLDRASLEG